jgi:transcriptional regulator with XRE-family HTH domain
MPEVQEQEEEEIVLLQVEGSDDEIVQSIAQFIRLRRRQINLSQQIISNSIGIDRAYFSRIERGLVHNISVWMLVRILTALNVRMEFVDKDYEIEE